MFKSRAFENLTQQSIYTIAFDMMFFKNFKKGEQVCAQYNKSLFNISYVKKEKEAIDKFTDKMGGDFEFQMAFRIFMKEKNPHYDDLCERRRIMKEYQDSVLKELNRRENLYGSKKVKEEDDELNEKKKRNEDDEEDTDNPDS